MPDGGAWDVLQSAALPYRLTSAGNVTVCLVTSRTRGRWIIPKGFIEPHLTPWVSAAKEAFEEAGVLGEISASSIGSYVYDKSDMRCKVDVYPLRVVQVADDWPEVLERERLWLPAEDAAAHADDAEVGEMILTLAEREGRA